MHYVYVLRLVGYSNADRAKVGCSQNVTKRIKNLRYCYGGMASILIGYFEYPDRKSAFRAETAAKRYFKPKRIRRSATEGFTISPYELIEFLQDHDTSVDLVRSV